MIKKKFLNIVFTNILLLVSLVLWTTVASGVYFVLKTGGDLRPEASTLGTLVEGVILDQNGLGVAGAKLVLQVDGNRQIYYATDRGKFAIYDLIEGGYRFTAEAVGYETEDGIFTVSASKEQVKIVLDRE